MNRNEITVCKGNNGVHEYIYRTDLGDECKHCGLLRSTIEQTEPEKSKALIPSPFMADFFPDEAELTPEGEKVETELRKRLRIAEERQIPTDVMEAILRNTKSRAALVITFDEPIETNPFTLRGFHISSANIRLPNLIPLFSVLMDALSGRFGGNMKWRKDEPNT